MKKLAILGIFALVVLLALPGAVSAADVTVSGSVVDEDLTVTAISPNVGAGAFMFANEPNVISVTVTNNGGLDAAASTVEVVIGTDTYTAAIPAITAGGSQTVTVTDTVSRTATDVVSVTATADSDDVIAESDETNNAMTSDLTVYNNGYKGKRYTPELGGDLATQASFDGRYDVVYSNGDTVYNSAGWVETTYSWTTADLPIPAGATVVSARLYQGYTYNKMGVDPAFTMSFNGNTVTPAATYMDIKGFGSYSYPYGLYVYDVTGEFNTAGNSMTITPEAGQNYGIYGAYLIVTYSDPATSEKQIRINDEFDMLQSRVSYSVNDAEATAYATFSGIDNADLDNAQAIAILASAGDTDKSKFFFNSQEYTGFWADYLSDPQIGFSVYDVTSALASGGNEAGLQSYDPGSNGDNMYAMNTILVVEKTEEVVTAAFSGTPLSGDAPLTVQFTDESTGYIVGYEWTFGDGNTSADASPSHEYTDRGLYTVSLTVTGVGSSDTETKTDYITVTEPAPVVDFTADPTSGTEPLNVAFDATNTGGAVDSWSWEYSDNGGTTWTEFATTEDASFTFSDGTYSVRVTATGPDFSDTETKDNLIQVGAATIDVTVDPGSIDFGTMQAGVDETGSTGVGVDVTGGTAWSVTASATNGGYMTTGSADLANAFQLANGGGAFQAMTSDFVGFMTGAQDEDRTDTANVLQSIDAADAPGSYSITLTFTGGFV